MHKSYRHLTVSTQFPNGSLWITKARSTLFLAAIVIVIVIVIANRIPIPSQRMCTSVDFLSIKVCQTKPTANHPSNLCSVTSYPDVVLACLRWTSISTRPPRTTSGNVISVLLSDNHHSQFQFMQDCKRSTWNLPPLASAVVVQYWLLEIGKPIPVDRGTLD